MTPPATSSICCFTFSSSVVRDRMNFPIARSRGNVNGRQALLQSSMEHTTLVGTTTKQGDLQSSVLKRGVFRVCTRVLYMHAGVLLWLGAPHSGIERTSGLCHSCGHTHTFGFKAWSYPYVCRHYRCCGGVLVLASQLSARLHYA